MKQLSKSILTSSSIVLIRAIKFLPANFSPLGSFGFFGQRPIFYFLSILFFDLMFGGFYTGFQWVYLAFMIYPLLGFLAKDKLKLQLLLLPLSSLLFFIISNFGVWLNWYPQTLTGFSQCYLLALPFLWRTLAGDLTFALLYFLVKKYASKWISSYQASLASSL